MGATQHCDGHGYRKPGEVERDEAATVGLEVMRRKQAETVAAGDEGGLEVWVVDFGGDRDIEAGGGQLLKQRGGLTVRSSIVACSDASRRCTIRVAARRGRRLTARRRHGTPRCPGPPDHRLDRPYDRRMNLDAPNTAKFALNERSTMTKRAIVPTKLAPPVGPFSAGIRRDGTLFISGQVGQDPTTGQLVTGGVEDQTRQIFANLSHVLETAGRSLADVLRAGVYLTDMTDFEAMNAVYAEHFDAPFPARTTIGVVALPMGAGVEIDLVVADS